MKNAKIAREKFDAIIAARPEGVTVTENASFTKLSAGNGLRIYVRKGKTVGQVDLSGFGKGFVGTVPLRAPNGRVQAQLDLSDERLALFHFEQLLKVMVAAPEAAKNEAEVPAEKPGSLAETTMTEAATRREAIKAAAQRNRKPNTAETQPAV